MPKFKENMTIENDSVMGRVSTNMVGSEVIFEICPVEEWEEMSDEEAEELAFEAMLSHISWSY